MIDVTTGQILEGLWRFEGVHPEWSEDEGGSEGWEPNVAWWALRAPAGLVLVDPLVEDWAGLDTLVEWAGGCAGIIRTCHWHERSVATAAERYDTEVWTGLDRNAAPPLRVDHPVSAGERILDSAEVIEVERADEIALWLPDQAALVFGDAMLRRGGGELQICPPSWTQPEGGRERLRELLSELTRRPVEHVLVSHGPLVLGDGLAQLETATGR